MEFSSFLAFDRRTKFFLWGLNLAFSSNKKGHLLQISYYPSCKSSLQNFTLYNEGTLLLQCQGFSVKSIPGKGLGLVATRSIRQGEVILSEDPLLFIPNEDNEMLKSLKFQFENLSAENKKKVLNLCDNNPEEGEEKKILRIFTVNRIQGRLSFFC